MLLESDTMGKMNISAKLWKEMQFFNGEWERAQDY